MEFCSKCGSYMKKTKMGFLCPRCWNVVRSNIRMRPEPTKKINHLGSIYVAKNSQEDLMKVSLVCPKCGNKEAFHWFSEISGEHAGIRRERTIEHFRCTKCSYSWNKSS